MSKLEPISPDSPEQVAGEPSANKFSRASPRSQCIMGQPALESEEPGQEVFSVLSVNCAQFAVCLLSKRGVQTSLWSAAQEYVMGVKEGQNIGCQDGNPEQVQVRPSRSR